MWLGLVELTLPLQIPWLFWANQYSMTADALGIHYHLISLDLGLLLYVGGVMEWINTVGPPKKWMTFGRQHFQLYFLNRRFCFWLQFKFVTKGQTDILCQHWSTFFLIQDVRKKQRIKKNTWNVKFLWPHLLMWSTWVLSRKLYLKLWAYVNVWNFLEVKISHWDEKSHTKYH